MNKFKFFYFNSFVFFYLVGSWFLFESMNYIFADKMVFYEYEVLSSGSSSFKGFMFLDWISLMFLSGVSIISGSILMYSCYYMKEEKNYMRFLCLMLLFIFSMWAMILSPNIVMILLGWDGLGLSSYLLVVYYQSDSASVSGMVTIMSNRVGDICILMSIWFLSKEATSWGFYFYDNLGWLVSFFCLVAAFSKSAQVPFSVWLPAAMAAPTPVSSLVHSSTLVTAGVYLMLRVFNLMEESVILLGGLLCLFTNMVSGLMTTSEKDFKKLIALSTLSQVSLMMVSVMSGLVGLGFFHLIMHAFFKSVMFMSTGFVIHSNNGSQDIRKFSSMSLSSPILMVSLYVTNLSLMGFPFMCGFFSKDLLLESLFVFSKSSLLGWAMVFSIFLTVYYSSLILKVLSSALGVKRVVYNNGDVDVYVLLGICFLSVLSCVFGFVFFWQYLVELDFFMFFDFEKVCIILTLMLSGLVASFWSKKSGSKGGMMLEVKKVFYGFLFSSEMLFFLKKSLLNANVNAGYLSDFGWKNYFEVVWVSVKFVGMASIIQKNQKVFLSVSIFVFFLVMVLFG